MREDAGSLPPLPGRAPALTEGVHETGFVRLALPADEDELPGDRFAGGAMALLPFLGAVWLPVGVQEQVFAECAASVLRFEQP